MATKNILVTGIGGNVGQGIIRNIQSLKLDVKITGTNVLEFTAGNYLCDYFHKVPYAFHDGFIDEMIKICNQQNIDLIIPSTDFEVNFLAEHRDKFSCPIAASHHEATQIYLDKFETWVHHNKYNIPFANSVLPSKYRNEFENIILKPKKGRGSRGLHLNPTNVASFADDEYMVQELHKGDEITTAFYITKQRQLHGLITMSRTLENGATNTCKVIFEHDKKITEIIEKMIAVTPIYGAANLQSIVTADGSIIPFEVNCRISGTNSIRSNFGFKDVEYTLQEYLYGVEPSKPIVTSGVAVRVLLDVIYPNQTDSTNLIDNTTPHFIF